tara:strand:+ start:5848 stop:6327 length:480 start_codon:yes stop_codon:yes gene_type:complete
MAHINKIELLVFDLDGVFTNGTVTISESGKEYKTISYQDLDAITKAQSMDCKIAVVTAEDTKMVKTITDRFKINRVIKGAKDKLKAIEELSLEYKIPFQNICYVADGERDVPALKKVGLSFAPLNATSNAKAASSKCLKNQGGNGAVKEVIEILLKTYN